MLLSANLKGATSRGNVRKILYVIRTELESSGLNFAMSGSAEPARGSSAARRLR
jgi:hypothetical protein